MSYFARGATETNLFRENQQRLLSTVFLNFWRIPHSFSEYEKPSQAQAVLTVSCSNMISYPNILEAQKNCKLGWRPWLWALSLEPSWLQSRHTEKRFELKDESLKTQGQTSLEAIDGNDDSLPYIELVSFIKHLLGRVTRRLYHVPGSSKKKEGKI